MVVFGSKLSSLVLRNDYDQEIHIAIILHFRMRKIKLTKCSFFFTVTTSRPFETHFSLHFSG